jgi:hypothetical protein
MNGPLWDEQKVTTTSKAVTNPIYSFSQTNHYSTTLQADNNESVLQYNICTPSDKFNLLFVSALKIDSVLSQIS